MIRTKSNLLAKLLAVIFILHFSVDPLACQSKNISNFIDHYMSLTNYIISVDERSNPEDQLLYLDSLFTYSVELTGSVSEALYLLTMTTLPHREIPVKIPLFSLSYNIPLPTLEENIFRERYSKLPSGFLFDSPSQGDMDKVSHFFGNAFLSYSIPWFNISEFMGILIELFERSIISVGEFDLRDLMINNLGNAYGKFLRINKEVTPASILKFYSLHYFRLYL